MPKSLKTKLSVWSAVFRRIVQQVEGDPDIRRVVGVDNVRSWKGIPADANPFGPAGGPVIRLSPMPRGVDWYSEGAQAGDLTVGVEIAVESLCIDDVADLYDLLVNALKPADDAFCRQLIALGAETGEIVFSDPAFDAKPDAQPSGTFLAAGSFHLRVLRMVNP